MGRGVLHGEGRPFGAGGFGGSLRRPDRPDYTADAATPLPRYCHANAAPLLARAAVPTAAAFLQVDPPPGEWMGAPGEDPSPPGRQTLSRIASAARSALLVQALLVQALLVLVEFLLVLVLDGPTHTAQH